MSSLPFIEVSSHCICTLTSHSLCNRIASTESHSSQVPLWSMATVLSTMKSHDVTSAVSLVEREGGDVSDDIIDSMVCL